MVVLHVSLGSETKAASQRTWEWAFIAVDKHVSLQILLLRKSLIAHIALERLSARMDVHVRSVAIQSGELFPTDLARVYRFSGCSGFLDG